MKRKTAISLLLVALMLIASACTGTPATSASGSSVPPAAATSAAAPANADASAAPQEPGEKYAEHVTISWVPQNDHEIPANANTKLALEEMFNWTLDVIYLDRNNETELLNVRLAAGEIPDVIRVGNDTRYKELAGQGVLKQLDESAIQQYAPSMYARMINMFEGYADNIFEYISIDGALYGFPIGNLNSTYAKIPVWRDDWLTKAGFESPPVEWNDVVTAFQFFTNEDPDGDGQKNTFALSNTGMEYLRDAAFGGDAFNMFFEDENGNLVPNILTGNYKLYVEAMADIYSQGLIDPEFITKENQGQYWAKSVTFINGVIGFACPGSYYHTNGPLYEGQVNPSTNHDPFYELNPDGSYTHGKTIKGPTGMQYAQVGGANPNGKVVIGKNIDDAAYVRFLEFHEAMFTDYDVYRLVVDGVKDIRWYDVELPDGRIAYQTYTDDELTAAGNPVAGKGNYTNGFGFLAEDCWEFLKRRDIALYDYADEVATPAALGGEMLTNRIWVGMQNTTRQKADMDTLRDQNLALFVTGQRPMSDWDTYIQELMAIGMQEWIDECNVWYAANK